MTIINDYYSIIFSNPAMMGVALIILSVIAAKCVDIIFSFIFKRLVNKTKTNLDDQMLALLHRPIFYSVLFVGFIFSIKTASLPDYFEFTFIGICKTITIIIWFFVTPKILLISYGGNASTGHGLRGIVSSFFILDPADKFIFDLIARL